MEIFEGLWDLFVRIFKGHNEVLSILAFFARDEGYGSALVTGSTCPAYTMDVVLDMVWTNVIYNELDVTNV